MKASEIKNLATAIEKIENKIKKEELKSQEKIDLLQMELEEKMDELTTYLNI